MAIRSVYSQVIVPDIEGNGYNGRIEETNRKFHKNHFTFAPERAVDLTFRLLNHREPSSGSESSRQRDHPFCR